MIGWIIDAIPYWVWIIVAAVALAATYPMWGTVWMLLPRWLKATIIFVGSLGVAYLAGRNRGFQNARDRQKEADAQATKRRLETNEEVGRMRPADRDKSLDKWMRD